MRRSCGLLFLFLVLLVLTGCWNRRELNDLALVVAMSIDKEEDQYLVTVQVVDPGEVASKQGSSGRSPVTTYAETGKHIFEAIRRMTTVTPRKLYFAHLQMLVISEEVAKEGISKPLEFVSRDPELRGDFNVVIAKKVKAKQILMNLTSLEKIPANKMRSSLETSERSWAPTAAIPLDELISAITSDGNNPVLTGITVKGDRSKSGTTANLERIDPFARLQYEGIAVFKKDKLVGWLNEKESKGYNYIVNRVKSTVGKIPCPEGGDMVVEVVRSKAEVKGKVENGEPTIDIKIHLEGNIAEVFCQIDLTQKESIKKMEESGRKTNENIVKAAIQKAKELKVDIFGFGEEIHRTDPKAWKAWKKDWDAHFVRMPISVHSEVKIRRTGTVSRSFMQKEKE